MCWVVSFRCWSRPKTSQRRLPHAPGHCLSAIEKLQIYRSLQFPHTVPFPQGENALVPLPFPKRSIHVVRAQSNFVIALKWLKEYL